MGEGSGEGPVALFTFYSPPYGGGARGWGQLGRGVRLFFSLSPTSLGPVYLPY